MVGILLVFVEALAWHFPHAEADDDYMDVCLTARLALPGEGAMGEVDLHSTMKQLIPEYADLLALRDRIGGDECTANRRALHVLRGAPIPAGDIVEDSRL